ncbi:hypothetical protein LAZ67_6000931 [Cordylochernes scorpioides]|uniref:Protein kinase domain-containing protein n=1 Tax=Cordylochernes scorpioides TaxID=51811 RepID=A0ABY6KIZ2_9ARAC|nr:hypothetical protein LAZ67_6000931 [Cordylochernes scorpioides]
MEPKDFYNALSNTIINRKTRQTYMKGEMLGYGGYACCLKVTKSKCTFACKVLLKDSKSNPRIEIAILKFLKHKNIVKYIDDFDDGEFIYIIMEYCESTLVDIYRKNITDENLILSYIHQIAEACHYLHTEKLFVHGDLKLENILIKDGTIKLADFGVSLRLASTSQKVEDIKSKKIFACKASVKNSKGNPLHEASILKSMSHKNIVQYYGHFSDNIFIYIITDYCETSLRDFQNTNSKDEDKIFSYIFQIAEACHYLHSEKYIIHRDLKPENILIKDGMVKLIDFGLSKQLSSISDKINTNGGTLEYKAPEIISKMPCGVEVDSWSLGCILYELLTNKRAFIGEDNKAIEQNIIECKFKMPSKISQSIINLIKGLLDPNPYTRISMKYVLTLIPDLKN